MLIKRFAHSCFLLQSEGGTRILTDPCDPATGYNVGPVEADCVTESHQHHDHNYRAGVALRQDGPANPFTITALPSFHDGCGGAKRGPNTIHLLEAQGLRVAHLGDIGAMPAPDVVEQLQNLDAVLVPVGGFYTVGPKEAKEIVDALQARVVIPMHYRMGQVGLPAVGEVEDFLSLVDDYVYYPGDTISINRGTRPQIAVLSFQG